MSCILCGGRLTPRLSKAGRDAKNYNIAECLNCGVWQIAPMPSEAELNALYQSDYFKVRSDRGYADYASDKIYRSVVSTLEKNLRDLNFFSWEKSLNGPKHLLEVGCAAGHAVAYFAARGWQALGIDIAHEMIEAGKSAGRPLLEADFLQHDFAGQKFSLITHWATLEHLPQAEMFLQRMAKLLADGGRIYLSTCNTGYFARRYGISWRYLNVPEHVFYFNHRSLQCLAKKCGLKVVRAFSYGSGFTTRENAPWWYNFKKHIADRLARYFLTGDMIVVEFVVE
ncbi:class I SAM-dependent methyltransferase [Turneriella parva]|uniref:Methyltransferase type 12 n=1 Tax=Turneriella parva (strain ATCC BAA-1111 / DSM 21527 / NCTC 11395 / H) TaxID=869212 RepID=I4B8F9_TURPD|nr:class I SAM-dependent methyltransferase [Turneriella parva]AFM13566.1 Methyltransferase type 12 [Turneriella parva DSM 21527]